MYLQIDLHPDDHKYQLILWRPEPRLPLQTYALTTITFGINSSPFLAIRTIQQLFKDYGKCYPRAAKILLQEIYVDDAISGAETAAEAKEILSKITRKNLFLSPQK